MRLENTRTVPESGATGLIKKSDHYAGLRTTRLNKINVVTFISIARQRLGKQARNKYSTNNRVDPLLGNGCVFCVVVRPEAV
jgi:hypothetical protein